MRKLILTIAIVAAANGSQFMCDSEWNSLIQENIKLEKAEKYNFTKNIKNHKKWMKHHAQKVVIECPDGSDRSVKALKILEILGK